MDLLGHVNNATYLDYLTEARRSLLGGLPAASARVTRHEVDYVRPLVYRPEPVLVDSWVSRTDGGLRVEQEVHDAAPRAGSADDRVVHLRATTTLDHRPDQEECAALVAHTGPERVRRPLPGSPGPPLGTGSPHRDAAVRDAAGRESRLHVRSSDVGADGLLAPVGVLDLFQESRIRFFATVSGTRAGSDRRVVARADLALHEPVSPDDAPYDVRTWVGWLGRTSFGLHGLLRSGERVLAETTTVLVTFDPVTQRPVPLSAANRAALERSAQDPARPA